MAFPSYTYTFTNASTADATQVNQNFSDILNGVTDGTKDISVSNATTAGTATLNGNVVLGNGTSKTITFNGAVASNIPISANTSWDFGTATLGLKSVYIGGTSTFTTRIMSAATASWTLTLPATAGSNGNFLSTDGSGNTSWAPLGPFEMMNIGLSTSVGSSQLTINLLTAGGATPSATNPVVIAFRNATSATGQYSFVSATAATSLVVSSGATLGQTSAVNQYVWVYAINNAGTIELAVSGIQPFDDLSIQSTTGVSGSSTSGTTLYSTSSRSNVPIRLIGRLLVNEATAGTWASNATEISLNPVPKFNCTPWADSGATTFASTGGTVTKGTVVIDKHYFKRQGQNLHGRIEYRHSGGSPAMTAGDLIATIANSLTIDTNLVSAYATAEGSGLYVTSDTVGACSSSNGTASAEGTVTVYDSTHIRFFAQSGQGSAGGALCSAFISFAGTTVHVTCFYIVPILGWTDFGP